MRILLDWIDPPDPDWLAKTTGPDAVMFRIRQHKRAPLRALATLALIPIIGFVLLLPVLLPLAPSKSGLGIFCIVVGGALVLVGGFITLIAALFLIPSFLRRRAETSFRITGDTLEFVGGVARGTPATASLGDVSHLYHGSPDAEPQTVTVSRQGVASGTGLFIARELGKTDNAVWVNHRGRKVFLARWLTEDEAEWLFREVAPHLGMAAEASAASA